MPCVFTSCGKSKQTIVIQGTVQLGCFAGLYQLMFDRFEVRGLVRVNLFIFIAYGCLVIFVSLASLQSISEFSIPHMDKVVHLVTYAVFTVLGYRVIKNEPGFLYICIGIVVFSGLMEVAQSFTPARMMSPADLLANMTGVVLANVFIKRSVRRSSTV
jgi:VanZ family protein